MRSHRLIPNSKLRVVSSNGVTTSGEFGISYADSAHIMTILRDTLYSDKVLAVLREYSSNAWDAHQSAGKKDIPIKVTLPTEMEPTLRIRDFGPGLSQQEVFEVFTQYGASTKRNDDNSVGMLGIGCKSAFAYSDSFTIESWYGGVKKSYVAVLDPSEKGVINMLGEEPCGDETGVLIQIAVRPEDIHEFEVKAQALFAYFLPRPDINTEIPELPTNQLHLKNGVIYDSNKVEDLWHRSNWIAVMGCVSYKVDLSQLEALKGEDGSAGFLQKISGALYFNIGDVQVSASREELKYNANTRTRLVEKLTALVDEYVQHVLEVIEKESTSPWDRRLRAQILRRLSLPVPEGSNDVVFGSVSIKGKIPGEIDLFQDKKSVSCIDVRSSSRIILWDDRRRLAGFQLTLHDYLVKPAERKTSWDSVRLHIDKMCLDAKITGIPVVKLSTLGWQRPLRKNGREWASNEKHQRSTFVLVDFKDHCHFGSPLSNNWTSVTRTPTQDDVFIVLDRFKSIDCVFYDMYREDLRLARFFDKKMPTVYGYKTTTTKPVTVDACIGRHYPIWREEFTRSLLTQESLKLLCTFAWLHPLNKSGYLYVDEDKAERTQEKLTERLGATHAITTAYRKLTEAKIFFRRGDSEQIQMLRILYDRVQLTLGVSEAESTLEAITAKYPLLAISSFGIEQTWSGPNAELWCDYVKMVDNQPVSP